MKIAIMMLALTVLAAGPKPSPTPQIALTEYTGYWWQTASVRDRTLYISAAIQSLQMGQLYVTENAAKTNSSQATLLHYYHEPFAYYIPKISEYYNRYPKEKKLDVVAAVVCVADDAPSYCK